MISASMSVIRAWLRCSAPPRRGRCSFLWTRLSSISRVAILGPSEEGPLRCDRGPTAPVEEVAILGPSEEGPLPPTGPRSLPHGWLRSSAPPRRGRCPEMRDRMTLTPRVAILGPSEEGPLRCDGGPTAPVEEVAILGPSEEGPLPGHP